MPDLIEECISDLVTDRKQRDYQGFEQTFCVRCRNPVCQRARWAADKFGARVSTQYDRFFINVIRALDPSDPRFIHVPDFHDVRRQALSVSGGWDMPEVPVKDGQDEVSRPSVTTTVDEAVRQLSKARGKEGPDLPEPSQVSLEGFNEETEQIMETEAPPEEDPPPPRAAPQKPLGNTPKPTGGILLGGGLPSSKVPSHVFHSGSDEWTPRKEKIVQPGTVITMGSDGDD